MAHKIDGEMIDVGNSYSGGELVENIRFVADDREGVVCAYADYGKHVLNADDVRALIKWLQRVEAESREEER